MSKAKRYTLETLLPLNVSYDSDHGLTQEDVDMVNSLVEVIESTRSKHTPGATTNPFVDLIDRHIRGRMNVRWWRLQSGKYRHRTKRRP